MFGGAAGSIGSPNDNRRMLRCILPALLGSILTLSACTPALNWRELRAGADGALKLLLPCKPDRASRPMPLLTGENVELHMLGCEADGILFAVSWADVRDASRTVAAQAQWQSAMLATLRAEAPQTQPFPLKGASAQPVAVRVRASGVQPQGGAVQAQGLWFARGSQVFHAVMYGERLGTDVTDTFFSGIEFQP